MRRHQAFALAPVGVPVHTRRILLPGLFIRTAAVLFLKPFKESQLNTSGMCEALETGEDEEGHQDLRLKIDFVFRSKLACTLHLLQVHSKWGLACASGFALLLVASFFIYVFRFEF